MDSRVAKRYARAMFAASLKENILASVEDDLNGIEDAFRRDPRFRTFLFSPATAAEDKLALVERVFSDRVTALTMHLLRLLLDKRRETELPLVRLEFIRLRRDHDQIVYVEVASAVALTDSEKKAIVAKIENGTGRKAETEFKIDGALIGGVRVEYDNFVLDGTVRGSLKRMRERLVYDLLRQT